MLVFLSVLSTIQQFPIAVEYINPYEEEKHGSKLYCICHHPGKVVSIQRSRSSTSETVSATTYDLEAGVMEYQQWTGSAKSSRRIYHSGKSDIRTYEHGKDDVEIVRLDTYDQSASDQPMLRIKNGVLKSTVEVGFGKANLPPIHQFNIVYPEIKQLPVTIDYRVPVSIKPAGKTGWKLNRVINDADEIEKLLVLPDKRDYVEMTGEYMEGFMKNVLGVTKEEFLARVQEEREKE